MSPAPRRRGSFEEPGTVRFERLLPGPAERIWRYLTESDKRGQWLATGELEPRVGGRVVHVFRHADLGSTPEPPPERYRHMAEGHAFIGRVTQCEPPRLLAYTWGDGVAASEVTFELHPRGDEVLLRLTHRRLGELPERVSVASGWHTHLELLEAHLRGQPLGTFWSTHTALEAEYAQALLAEE